VKKEEIMEGKRYSPVGRFAERAKSLDDFYFPSVYILTNAAVSCAVIAYNTLQ